MEINEFARMAKERNHKHIPKLNGDWEYHLISMAGECGEILNILKKVKRGDFSFNAELRDEIAEEIADVVTYCFLAQSELGVDAEKTIMEKFEKVNKRIEKGGFHIRN